jgi:hypothetical protein
MKCIKAIRKTKEVELGEIKRVDDKTAHNMVGLSWSYVSKTEWKLATRKPKSTEQESTQVTEQVEKKPYKKGSKPEKKSKKDEKNS